MAQTKTTFSWNDDSVEQALDLWLSRSTPSLLDPNSSLPFFIDSTDSLDIMSQWSGIPPLEDMAPLCDQVKEESPSEFHLGGAHLDEGLSPCLMANSPDAAMCYSSAVSTTNDDWLSNDLPTPPNYPYEAYNTPDSSCCRSSDHPSMGEEAAAAPEQPALVAKQESERNNWVPDDIFEIGYQDSEGNWRCKFSSCRANIVFQRACDLRKHYQCHLKRHFCTHKDCSWSWIGFSFAKDLRRHLRSHDPALKCSFPDCARTFSRQDNMLRHYNTVHIRLQNNLFPRRCRRAGTRKKATGAEV